MHQRLRTRARRIEREPEPPQPAGGRPTRRSLAVPHGKMLRKPGEQNIPALVADRSRRIFEQTQPDPGWFLAVLLKEFNRPAATASRSPARPQQDEQDRQELAADTSRSQRSQCRVDRISTDRDSAEYPLTVNGV